MIPQATKRSGRSRPPSLSEADLHAAEKQATYRREREILERGSVLRGLILLAILVVLFAVVHGEASRAFPAGWWRQW